MVKDLISTLKALANKRREISLIDISKYDSDYANVMKRIIELDEKREALNLPQEARETMDEFLKALDAVEEEQVNLSYLAGMADCLIILDRLELFQL